jgi:hypothetical protein
MNKPERTTNDFISPGSGNSSVRAEERQHLHSGRIDPRGGRRVYVAGDPRAVRSKDSAFEFALRSATAFVEGRPMPRAPFKTAEAKDVCSQNRPGSHEKGAAAPESQVDGSRR